MHSAKEDGWGAALEAAFHQQWNSMSNEQRALELLRLRQLPETPWSDFAPSPEPGPSTLFSARARPYSGSAALSLTCRPHPDVRTRPVVPDPHPLDQRHVAENGRSFAYHFNQAEGELGIRFSADEVGMRVCRTAGVVVDLSSQDQHVVLVEAFNSTQPLQCHCGSAPPAADGLPPFQLSSHYDRADDALVIYLTAAAAAAAAPASSAAVPPRQLRSTRLSLQLDGEGRLSGLVFRPASVALPDYCSVAAADTQ